MITRQHLILDDQAIFDQNDQPDNRWDLPIAAGLLASDSPRAIDTVAFPAEDHAGHQIPRGLNQAMQANEYNVIVAALEGSQSRNQAAQKLGISPRTLRHKLQRLREQGITVTRAYAR